MHSVVLIALVPQHAHERLELIERDTAICIQSGLAKEEIESLLYVHFRSAIGGTVSFATIVWSNHSVKDVLELIAIQLLTCKRACVVTIHAIPKLEYPFVMLLGGETPVLEDSHSRRPFMSMGRPNDSLRRCAAF